MAALSAASMTSLARSAAPSLAVRATASTPGEQLSASSVTFADRNSSSTLASSPAALTWSSRSPATNLVHDAAFASLVCASGGSNTFNTQILVGETESTESVVRRFKKACLEANIVNECRRRRYFETKQDIIKRKQRDAARQRKRFQRMSSSGPRMSMFIGGKEKATDAEPTASSTSQAEDDEADWNQMQ